MRQLDDLKEELNFPAIKNDIGHFLNSLIKQHSLKKIFEFGSGYGHSAFWYFSLGANNFTQKVFLTEVRNDLESLYEKGPLLPLWKNKIDYFQGDAFDQLESVSNIDLVLIDGKKSDYWSFIEKVFPRLNSNGFIAIDNAFWKGSVIEDGVASKTSTKSIRELHSRLQEGAKSGQWTMNYFPFRDGLILLQASKRFS